MKFKEFLTESSGEGSQKRAYDSKVKITVEKKADELSITVTDNPPHRHAPNGLTAPSLSKAEAKKLTQNEEDLAEWVTEHLLSFTPSLTIRQEDQMFEDLVDIVEKFARE